MIRAIAALDDERGIARSYGEPTLPWDIPADRHYFREAIKGSTVIMGSTTYKTLRRPFADCRNIVISNSLLAIDAGFELISDLESCIKHSIGNIWIIGGGSLYAAALKYCDELYLTHISGTYNCDVFFPEYKTAFTLTHISQQHMYDGYNYQYAVYSKNHLILS